jgi:hypothetical protein
MPAKLDRALLALGACLIATIWLTMSALYVLEMIGRTV